MNCPLTDNHPEMANCLLDEWYHPVGSWWDPPLEEWKDGSRGERVKEYYYLHKYHLRPAQLYIYEKCRRGVYKTLEEAQAVFVEMTHEKVAEWRAMPRYDNEPFFSL
jgi:hypothetical protein